MIGAVDIGGTKIAVGLVDEDGRVLSRTECPTAPERGYAEALARIEDGPVLGELPKTLRVPAGEAYVGIENPRGELGHYVVSDGNKIAVRVRVRGPSFTNLAVVEDALPGSLVGDAIAIIGSTDIVVGETDR